MCAVLVLALASCSLLEFAATPGKDGVDGKDGIDGEDGKDGVDGTDVPQIPDHTHNYSEWKYYSDNFESCEDALYFRTCSGCNAIEWKDGSEDDHKYVVVITPPTCYSIGYTTKTCSKCGKTVVCDETTVVDHTYSTTYTSDGSYHWRQCKYCDRKADYAEHGLDENGICTVCSMLIGDTAGVIYEISADGTYAEVVGYIGTAKQVKIASEYKGLPVTNIYSQAFYNNDNVTHVVIPDSVTTIGDSAFYSCDSLTSVTIGDSVTTIGYNAFYNCTSALYTEYEYGLYVGDASNPYKMLVGLVSNNLSTYTIHEDTRYIQGGVFEACSRLVSIDIPDSVTAIGDYAFNTCSKLTNVTIPDSVTTIGSYAFYDCYSLTSVTIGDSVTTIGDGAFWYCSSLTSVTIGDSVTTIGNNAFYNCTSLTSVTIPDSVTTIGSSVFYNCNSALYTEYEYGIYVGDASNPYKMLVGLVSNNLSTYTIHEDTRYIQGRAFANYSRLVSIDIPDSVTTIGYGAFESCISLTSVTIPDSITTIGNYAFEYCSSLKDVYITDVAAWCNISFGDYYANPLRYATNLYLNGELITELVIPAGVTVIPAYAFYRQSSITSVIIGDSVTSIGYNAFSSCSLLTSVTIPDSVTTIGDGAFHNCSSLTSVTIGDSVTTIGKYAFDYCSKLTSVIFEDPTGWWYADSADATGGFVILESSLANPSTAASYLRSSYYYYYWFKD